MFLLSTKCVCVFSPPACWYVSWGWGFRCVVWGAVSCCLLYIMLLNVSVLPSNIDRDTYMFKLTNVVGFVLVDIPGCADIPLPTGPIPTLRHNSDSNIHSNHKSDSPSHSNHNSDSISNSNLNSDINSNGNSYSNSNSNSLLEGSPGPEGPKGHRGRRGKMV